MRLNAVLAAPGFEQWFDGEPLDPASLLHTADGRPRVVIFSIAHLGDAGADVLRLAAASRDGRVDARADRNVEPARRPLHGRDRRLLPAGGEPAVQAAAADAAETGTRVRAGRGPGHAESGRPRLQGAVEHRHVVPRAAADGARQGARAGRARGSGRRRRSIALRRIAFSRRSASACSCCTTCTRARPSCFTHAGRSRIFAARCRAIRFAR